MAWGMQMPHCTPSGYATVFCPQKYNQANTLVGILNNNTQFCTVYYQTALIPNITYIDEIFSTLIDTG